MRREARSATSISSSVARVFWAGQPSRLAASVMRFQLRAMLGSRSSVSKEARKVASVMVISVIAAAPMLRAAADYSHRGLAQGFRSRSIGAFWWQLRLELGEIR